MSLCKQAKAKVRGKQRGEGKRPCSCEKTDDLSQKSLKHCTFLKTAAQLQAGVSVNSFVL